MKALLNKDYFLPNAQRFDLANPDNLLRIWSTLFMFPQAISKFSNGELSPEKLHFFAAVGFHPASFWLVLAACSEIGFGLLLLLGVAPLFTALALFGVLGVALFSLIKVNGLHWYWNIGGIEYTVFWAGVLLIVAWREWQMYGKPRR